MARAYTNMLDFKVDLQLYVTLQKNGTFDLSLFPALAKQRFSWIVSQWNTLYKTFKTFANGNQKLEAALEDFDSSVRGYKLSTSRNPINPLDNSDKFDLYSDFLALIDIRNMGLTTAESTSVANELQRISDLNSDDFKSMLKFLNNHITASSSRIGLYDEDGFRVLGAVSVDRAKSATISDLDYINGMLDIKKYIESILLNFKNTVDRPPNLLAIANQNISGGYSSINETYRSYLTVPFMQSLEQMAQDYMGDKSLWYELVTINNLQPPYIDMVGQKYSLVAPGAQNNLTISADRRNDVHIGTSVAVGSVKVREELRIVNKISYNSDNTMVLYLSGEQDLQKLKPAEGGYVRIYAPHTIHDRSFIKIPVDITSGLPVSLTPSKDELRRLDAALLNFGVDIAENSDGDLVVASNGNFAMAYGLQNVRQAIKNVLNTYKTELPFHPNYGIVDDIGSKMYGPGDQSLVISEMVKATIMKDPRFVSVEVKQISFTGTSVSMTILVKIQGSSQLIPLSFVG